MDFRGAEALQSGRAGYDTSLQVAQYLLSASDQ